MKQKNTKLMSQQKVQVQSADDLLIKLIHCAKNGALRLPLTAISRDTKTLNALLDKARLKPGSDSMGIAVLTLHC